MKTIKHVTLLITAIAVLGAGCKTMNRTQKGAIIGAGGGAAVGAVVGKALGHTAAGAIVGATVGGAAGAVIGHKMDQQADEMKRVLDDGEVRRVGEGIVIEFKEKILFAFDRSDLNATAQQNLNKLDNVLNKYPDTDIEILGHTDDQGSADYNLGLSQRRAASVADYLKAHGTATTRITTKGMGETDPKVPNISDANRAENRRVEFVITANQKMKDAAKKEAGQ